MARTDPAVEAERKAPQVTFGERGQQAEELDADAERGAESQPEKIVRTRERVDSRRGVDEVKPDQHGDADDVVRDRDPRSDAEAVADVEQRGGDADHAVEEDLWDEPTKERRCDGALLAK